MGGDVVIKKTSREETTDEKRNLEPPDRIDVGEKET